MADPIACVPVSVWQAGARRPPRVPPQIEGKAAAWTLTSRPRSRPTVSFSGNPDRVRQFRAVMHGLTCPGSGGEIMDADGITAFIEARLGELEAAAAGAAPYWPPGALNVLERPDHEAWFALTVTQARHVAANDPARVLRQAAAIRRILERHHDDGEGWCTGCGVSMFDGSYDVEADECREKKDLAAIWETHPEYEAGWKP